jgi:predicted O-methyltransferase YrrM
MNLDEWHALKTRIPGWFAFAKVYDNAVTAARDGAVFVEVGSWKGLSAYYMASKIRDSGKRIHFYCVDHWIGSVEHQTDPDVLAGTLYETFLRNVADVREYLEPLRMSSVEAATRFSDGSCALVLLDAGHTYSDVRKDIAAWWPKVGPGAVLAGDDYDWEGVRLAVHDVFGAAVEVLGKEGRRNWRMTKSTG